MSYERIWPGLRAASCLRWMLLLAFCMAVRAQTGYVKSGSQAIPGATVTAKQGSRQLVTTTDQDGRYALPAGTDGIWTLEVQMFGFQPNTRQVNFAESKVADFNLQLRDSPMASRMARFQGNRGNGETANSLEAQI